MLHDYSLFHAMTIPTQLTLLRLFMTGLIVGLLFVSGYVAKVMAFIGFILASLTDWLDGYLARRWQQKSALGMLLDPIADKVLVLSVLFAFVILDLLPLWMVVVIALREVLVTLIRLVAASRSIILPAEREGKYKTVSQMITILFFLSVLILREALDSQPKFWLEKALWVAAHTSLWLALSLTVFSGMAFLVRLKGAFHRNSA